MTIIIIIIIIITNIRHSWPYGAPSDTSALRDIGLIKYDIVMKKKKNKSNTVVYLLEIKQVNELRVLEKMQNIHIIYII
jgi:hypothetical protein